MNATKEAPKTDLEQRLDAYEAQARAVGTSATTGLRRWSAFAAAAGSSLAFATAADAGIIYSGPIDKTITIQANQPGSVTAKVPIVGKHSFFLDLANSLHLSGNFFLRAGVGLGVAGHSTSVGVKPSGPYGGFPLQRFVSGSKISIHQSAAPFGVIFENATYKGHHFTAGSWPPGQPAFAGFGFATGNGGFDLGWARLEWNDNPSTHTASLELFDFAYNTTPNASILAGQTVPEPGTLGLMLLALGSSGVLGWPPRLKATG